jgi:hypothetical protein
MTIGELVPVSPFFGSPFWAFHTTSPVCAFSATSAVSAWYKRILLSA